MYGAGCYSNSGVPYRTGSAASYRLLVLLVQYSYEAGRLYGTTEVIRQCTEHEAPLNLFYCCFMPI